jgi:putative membrane protein
MLIQRRIPRRLIFAIGARVMLLAGSWASVIAFAYAIFGFRFLSVSFLPIATIGTAVAFYVGFKNNSAYERFWEGRKIWGGIVNANRSWAAAVLAYVDARHGGEDTQEAKRRLIYRQLAWTNALRLQLRQKSRFMQADAHKTVKKRLAEHAAHMRSDWDKEISPFLSPEELVAVNSHVNPATHLLKQQALDLAELRHESRLDLFHQIDLMQVVKEFYSLQGQCERIKNTPFPRQYAEFSRWFVRVFMFLLPFGLLSVFGAQIDAAGSPARALLAAVPMILSAGLISWVFITMEGVGDASEDPFERSMNDVPMNALCRTIERDLMQMLGETAIPEPEQPIGLVLY